MELYAGQRVWVFGNPGACTGVPCSLWKTGDRPRLHIRMFFNDHVPPHFHVEYAEYKAVVDVVTLEVREGHLPRRALNLVLDWAELHQDELLEDWRLCQAKQLPNPIAPLP